MQKQDIELNTLRKWIENSDRGKTEWNRAPKERVSYWRNFNLYKIVEDGLLVRKWVSKKDIEDR